MTPFFADELSWSLQSHQKDWLELWKFCRMCILHKKLDVSKEKDNENKGDSSNRNSASKHMIWWSTTAGIAEGEKTKRKRRIVEYERIKEKQGL